MVGKPPIPEELWAKIPADAQAALHAVFQHYEQRLADLQRQVDDLGARLGQSSRNSSRPPSSDPPRLKPAPRRPRSGRRRGGQPDHPLQQRAFLEPTQPPVILRPQHCRGCGRPLCGADPAPLRHQVLELPALRPEVTDYYLHRLGCPACGVTTCAPLPPGVPRGQYGPRLQAALALLSGAYRLSKRMIETLCADLLGVPICAGQVCKLEARTADATEPVVAPLRDYVRTQDVLIDETGWRQNGRRGWLWAAVAAWVTVFHVADRRSGKVARQLLGPGYRHVASTDRYNAYHWLPARQRQVCWAHLQRDFQAMAERGGDSHRLGEELLCCAEELFHWWHRVRDGTLARSTFRRYMAELRPHVRKMLERGAVGGCAKTAGVCQEILKLEPCLWTFVRVEGIEPTNNGVERALRHAVQWRKVSYGSQGESGGRFVSNILTVVATCRQQGHNVLEFLTECCRAHLQASPAPSLIPQTT
jgi:transposase